MKTKLKLIRERKLYKLLPECKKKSRLEASGVAIVDGYAYVVFDNLKLIGKIDPSLKLSDASRLIQIRSISDGFEDITFDPRNRRFYLIIEAEEDTDGKYRALVEEYDQDFRFQRCTRLSTAFESENKGFEGLAHLWRGDKEYLLALCEGNLCTDAKKGGGRVQVFERTPEGNWKWSHEVALPMAAEFKDYAAIKMQGSRIALVSQASHRLWIGEVDQTAHAYVDDGVIYKFPDKAYCNVEGVAWLSDDHLIVVSDRKKAKQRKRCAEKDQSIHIFQIPDNK